jgi:hypothetical protein
LPHFQGDALALAQWHRWFSISSSLELRLASSKIDAIMFCVMEPYAYQKLLDLDCLKWLPPAFPPI